MGGGGPSLMGLGGYCQHTGSCSPITRSFNARQGIQGFLKALVKVPCSLFLAAGPLLPRLRHQPGGHHLCAHAGTCGCKSNVLQRLRHAGGWQVAGVGGLV
jgi:hypothetical protein